MRALRAWGLLGVVLAGGCSGSDAVGPGDRPGISVSIESPAAQVGRAAVVTAVVTVSRTGGFEGPVALWVEGAPAGVATTTDTVPVGATIGLLHFDVGFAAAAGTTTVTIRATSAGVEPAEVDMLLTVSGGPPLFEGTIFIDPDIITEEDPTTLVSVVYSGRGDRRVFDRRVDGWITMSAYLFDVTFSDGLSSEAQVNPEFTLEEAGAMAQRYADAMGRLPKALRRDVDALWIHWGVELFGGGNRSILIHTGQGELYEAEGILEETLAHEAAHTSLDAAWAASAGWLQAQRDDGTFISTYARDYPTREDVAETIVPYIAVRYRADRIPSFMANAIDRAIPFRMAFLDSLGLDMTLLAGN